MSIPNMELILTGQVRRIGILKCSCAGINCFYGLWAFALFRMPSFLSLTVINQMKQLMHLCKCG